MKPWKRLKKRLETRVAPRRGAWIETASLMPYSRRDGVAPRRGAWIETLYLVTIRSPSYRSHPAGVRGLKRWLCGGETHGQGVAPRRGAWIETACRVPGADS